MNTRILAILLLFVLTGCNGSPSQETPKEVEPSPSSAPSRSPLKNTNVSPEAHPLQPPPPVLPQVKVILNPAKNLGFRIIPEAQDGFGQNLPDPAIDIAQDAKFEATIEKNDIVIHTKLYLQDENSPNPEHRKKVYFVWPETLLDSKISSASFSHRIWNQKKQLIGNFKPKPAWHDVDHHRWFIPLKELYEGLKNYNEVDVSLEDTQLLTLELVLENGPNIVIQIRFQVSGPLPVTRVFDQQEKPLGEMIDFVKTTSNEGWPVKTESITNPMPRVFTLWLRTRPKPSDLKMKTYLHAPYYVEQAEAPPQGPYWNESKSSGSLRMDLLKVHHEGGNVEVLKVGDPEWVSVSLLPLETITLEWIARVAPHTVNCALPPSSNVQLNWLTVHPQTYHMELTAEAKAFIEATGFHHLAAQMEQRIADPLIPPTLHSQAFKIDWSILGASIVGNWGREIRLTHSFTSRYDATRDPVGGSAEYLILNENSLDTRILVGEEKENFGDFVCQGVFR